jgi:hypothetical protein
MRRLVGGYGIYSRPLGRLSAVGLGYLEASVLLLALIHEHRGREILRSSTIRVAPVQPDGWDTIWFVTFTERPQDLTLVFDGA